MILFQCNHRGCKVDAISEGIYWDVHSGAEFIRRPLGDWLLMEDGKVYCPKHNTEERQAYKDETALDRPRCLVRACASHAAPDYVLCHHHLRKHRVWEAEIRQKGLQPDINDFCDLHGGKRGS